jgi:hypothetical protein
MRRIELESPAEMSPGARAAEITAIVAACIIRTFAPDESTLRVTSTGEGLGFDPDQRVHTTPYLQEKL